MEQGQRFRKHGSHTPLHELYAKWSQKWSKRLAGSKGRVLTEVDLCFEALQLKAAKEAAELHGLEVAFDEAAGGTCQGAPHQQAAARVATCWGASPLAAPSYRRRGKADPCGKAAPRTPPAADEAAPST